MFSLLPFFYIRKEPHGKDLINILYIMNMEYQDAILLTLKDKE